MDSTLPIGEGYRVTSVATPAGPCPQCGAPAGIVDGSYDIHEGRAVSRWRHPPGGGLTPPVIAGGGSLPTA